MVLFRTKDMISVAIVDSQRDIREGFKLIIDSAEGFCCMEVFEDGESAINGVLQLAPDVVLMGIDLPKMSGIEATRVLKKEMPKLDIIMLSLFKDDEHIFQSLRAGAIGYLSKNIFPSKLLRAIKEVQNGGSPMSSDVARRVVTSFNKISNQNNNLSNREKEVLDLLCEGNNYREIAEQLFVSPNTVRFHLKNIYKKLEVNSKYEAVMKATKEGIV